MHEILSEVLETYLSEKRKEYTGNKLADKLRNEFPKTIEAIIPNPERYMVVGSPGKGGWTHSPWIAVLDTHITKTAQAGYYPVYLFKADMSGVYLSLNQGVTSIEGGLSSKVKTLKNRASVFRTQINSNSDYLAEIDLTSKASRPRQYEAGNIIAKYYNSNNIPTTNVLVKDLRELISIYRELVYNDSDDDSSSSSISITETRRYRTHRRLERQNVSGKIKALKGYICEACDFNFVDKYGELGKQFIEAHHLKPISTIGPHEEYTYTEEDFSVLCSNCHRMIHRLEDSSRIDILQNIISDHQ